MLTQAVHGSGCVEKKDSESECPFMDRGKRKAHMMTDQMQSVPDSELFGVESEYNSGEDSDYTGSDVFSLSSTGEVEDDLPFVCDECNKIFKTQFWFNKHMQAGVHRAPAVSMKQFVAKQMQFHVAQSKQVTSMHFKMERVHKDGGVVPLPAALQGYVENALPFKQGWARKPKRQRGVACMPEVKQFLRDCFLAAYDEHGEKDRSKLISKGKAFELLKIKIEEMKWPAEAMRSVQQIAGHYSQFKKIMLQKSWDALKQEQFEVNLAQFGYDSGSNED